MRKSSAANRVQAASRFLPWAIVAAALIPGGFAIGGAVLAFRAVRRMVGWVRCG